MPGSRTCWQSDIAGPACLSRGISQLRAPRACSAAIRYMGSRLGFAAVNALIAGKTQMMVGLEANHIKMTGLEEALNQHQFKLEEDLMQMAEILSI